MYNQLMGDNEAFYKLDQALECYAQEEKPEIYEKLIASIENFQENAEKEEV